jgi:hypothetical protein
MSAAGTRCVLALLTGLGAAACSTDSGLPDQAARAGLACVDDSRQCIDQRAAALRSLIGDKARKWVREPASAAAYASGVRLFAYKQRKKELTCEELAIGRREADSAAPTLRGPGGAGLTPAQVSRGVMFGQEVARELAAEHGRRCKA